MSNRGSNQGFAAQEAEWRGDGMQPVASDPSGHVPRLQPDERPVAGAAAEATALPPSLLVEDLTITGNISSEGRLHIKGNVRGDIVCRSAVIGANSMVEGTILADSVELHGRMNGMVYADKVRLHSSSRFDGDIHHQVLSIEDGAHFVGRSLRTNDPKAMAQTSDATPKQAAPTAQTAGRVEAAPAQKRRAAA